MRVVKEDILNQNDEMLERTLIFGDIKLSKSDNTEISKSLIEYILASKRCDVELL